MTTSAGLLLWRRAAGGGVEVLLGHMGGPFWARKDEHAWSIPKGEHTDGEDPLAAARREFAEELGLVPPDGEVTDLGEGRATKGKRIRVFALEADLDLAGLNPGTFTMQWPPRSGQTAEFPEIDRAEWLPLEVARRKLVKGQLEFLDRLAASW